MEPQPSQHKQFCLVAWATDNPIARRPSWPNTNNSNSSLTSIANSTSKPCIESKVSPITRRAFSKVPEIFQMKAISLLLIPKEHIDKRCSACPLVIQKAMTNRIFSKQRKPFQDLPYILTDKWIDDLVTQGLKTFQMKEKKQLVHPNQVKDIPKWSKLRNREAIQRARVYLLKLMASNR